jgi:hypothetical protein
MHVLDSEVPDQDSRVELDPIHAAALLVPPGPFRLLPAAHSPARPAIGFGHLRLACAIAGPRIPGGAPHQFPVHKVPDA